MALDTEAPFGTAMEKVFVHGADIGIMTTHAVHGHPVARIPGAVPLGMGETLVPLMTAGANILRGILDHARPVGAMQIVAIGAFVPAGVLVQHLRAAGEGAAMAGTATGAFVGREQSGAIAHMGVVTSNAGVAAVDALQVTMGAIERAQHLLVATETGIRSLALAMTGLAVALGKGLVLNAAQQSASLRAVGMVTPQAVEAARFSSQMGLSHPLLVFVTAETEPRAGVLEQSVVIAAVGIVAGSAAALLKRPVRAGIGLFQLLMATKTELFFRFIK